MWECGFRLSPHNKLEVFKREAFLLAIGILYAFRAIMFHTWESGLYISLVKCDKEPLDKKVGTP